MITMNAESAPGTVVCAYCQSPNANGSRFCKGCGKPMPAAQSAQTAQSVPPPVSPTTAYRVADAASIRLPLDAVSAFASVAQAITRIDGLNVVSSPPHTFQYQRPYPEVNLLWKLPNYWKLLFDCTATLQPIAPDATQLSLVARVQTKGLVIQISSIVFATVVLMLTDGPFPKPLVLLAALVSAAMLFFTVSRKGPQHLRRQLFAAIDEQLQAGVASSRFANEATAAGRAEAPTHERNIPSSATPAEQLQRLAELKQLGAITEAEFTAKKTELLARW